jgi:conjugative transfer signal peptidase TraF
VGGFEVLKVHTVVPFVVIGISCVVVAAAVTLLKHFGPPLLINETPSEPRGIYRLVPHAPGDYQRGMYVIFPVPAELRAVVYGRGWLREGIPLLKELLGMPGDRVCISREALRINERYIGPVFERDSHGMVLPQHPGCFVIPEGHFLPASQHLANSFDGRYFGAIPMRDLTGEARPVWTF